MSHAPFSSDWLHQFTDPYAVLGVSVAADERRILKRYHAVAKQLHPDVQTMQPAEHEVFIGQILPKLVNPAYQRLKQDKTRNETLATLRFKVRRLTRDAQLKPQGTKSCQLLGVPEADVDMLYEHALEQLSAHQYASAESFETATQLISELNLVYLRRKMGNPIIREKRTGLISAPPPSRSAAATATASAPPTVESPSSSLLYAERHFQRAHEYLKAKNVSMAIQELKDALKLDPQNSNYHCLMGQAYLLNRLTGMAKVHFKQALKFNPKNEVALKYARQLKIDLEANNGNKTGKSSTAPSNAQPKPANQGRLFSRLFSNR
ncbi:MAG: DnaJ domain-containing protein [Leptolyngbyaceae cyanobacterium SM2_5_2]|nr:DnaJ domain-containing protein [Leptolyngbyaceae cyanobacterium SM2_5_2]